MSSLEASDGADWEATLTCWRSSIPDGSTAEDSIRAGNATISSFGKSRPRSRTLQTTAEKYADFELGKQLGSGGMGVVYSANQTAFDREVAVKMVSSGRGDPEGAADALLTEAVITGGLEHPNVVPVYDLGIDPDGNLFYAMKEVRGVPWSQLMCGMELEENLDILLRVADTVSFAHSRGVLHRDLKPQNIMLGEFGEVMVMDWGASVVMSENASSTGFCGTPAYMPPEMARADESRMGEASDVYLLGAILYQILEGHAPRREKEPLLCIHLASENSIEPMTEEGELARIALSAMISAPIDRFSSVREFQDAVREYRSHSESRLVQANASANLERAKAESSYDLFSLAVFGFREARQLWPENSEAKKLQPEAELAYARCAFERDDYELALSLLDPEYPAHSELLELIRRAIRDRDAHKRRNRQLLLTARFLAGILLLFLIIAFLWIRAEQRETADAHRRSLEHLVVAQYGDQNYEATIASFWQLHDLYGMDQLEEGSLLDIRVAVAMNPHRGTVPLELQEPLGIVPSSGGDVWIVGKNHALKVKVEADAGFETDTRVSIHDFSFGKRRVPVEILETVALPHSVASKQSFLESADRTLWMGSGSVLYHQGSNGWNPVLDIRELEFPPLPAEYNIDRSAVEAWMDSEGRKLPISGILLNRAGTHAAIALGPQTVCWVELERGRCLGWLAVGHGTRYGGLLQGDGDVLLELSADETRLLYRPSVYQESMMFWFRLPDMRREAYAYNRDYPLRGVSFTGSQPAAIGLNGLLYAAKESITNRFDTFYKGVDDDNKIRWGLEKGTLVNVPCTDIELAAFSRDGSKCAMLTESGRLASVLWPGDGSLAFESCIIERDYVDLSVIGNDIVLLLDESAGLSVYDIGTYSVTPVDLDGSVTALGRWADGSDMLVGLVNGSGEHRVSRITARGDEELLLDRKATSVAVNPDTHLLAITFRNGCQVFDLRDGKTFFQPTNWPWQTQQRLTFTSSGKFIQAGSDIGEWRMGVFVLDTDTWEKVPIEFSNLHLQFSQMLSSGEDLVFVIPVEKVVVAFADADGTSPPLERWRTKFKSSPTALIPYRDPETGERRYWCQMWFNAFIKLEAETGEQLESFDHWIHSGIGHPDFAPNGRHAAFSTGDGGLQVALATDLYPVFDPRALDIKVDRAVFSIDESQLYLLSGHRLFSMPWPSSPRKLTE